MHRTPNETNQWERRTLVLLHVNSLNYISGLWWERILIVPDASQPASALPSLLSTLPDICWVSNLSALDTLRPPPSLTDPDKTHLHCTLSSSLSLQPTPYNWQGQSTTTGRLMIVQILPGKPPTYNWHLEGPTLWQCQWNMTYPMTRDYISRGDILRPQMT